MLRKHAFHRQKHVFHRNNKKTSIFIRFFYGGGCQKVLLLWMETKSLTKMKNLNRISALLLSLFFSIMSCEKNNEPEKYQEISAEQLYLEQKISSTNMEKVSLDRIPQVARYLKEFTGNQIFSKNNKSAPIIDTENIIAISDTLGNTNYSFGFYLPNQKKNKKGRLYNLIVGVNNEGIMSNPMVLRLTPDKKHMEEWIENDLDFAHFNGKVSLHKFTDYFDRNPFETGTDYCPPEFDQNGDPIECVIDEVTSGGSGTSSGGSYAPSGGVSGGCTYSMYWNYCGGTNEGIAHPSGPAPVCGGDGSGAGWVLETTCPNYTDITIFHKNGLTAASDGCADCATGPSGSIAINDYSKSVVKLDYYLDHNIDYQLTYSQLTWLNINPDKAYEINQFLKLNGFSPLNVYTAQSSIVQLMLGDVDSFGDFLRFNRTSNNINYGESGTLPSGNYDNTSYSNFNPQQAWPTINPIIPVSDFVGWGAPNIEANCFSYAKAQIAKKGYTLSSYHAPGQMDLQQKNGHLVKLHF